MKDQEAYYQNVLKNRKLVKDPNITKCSCPNTLCDWHSKCTECVALHRHYNNHLPICLQPLLTNKLVDLASLTESTLTKKTGTPLKYREYVKKKDQDSD